jgi:hypothetical protein
MVRACSYEVGGDVTNPRLANLIERAKVASVPKVYLQHSSLTINFFVILTVTTQSIIERAVAKGLGLGKGGEEVCCASNMVSCFTAHDGPTHLCYMLAQ